MATTVVGRLPADEFALSATLRAVPDVAFRAERVIEAGGDTVMPLLWAHVDDGTLDGSELTEALREDPTTDGVTLLGDFDDEWLYRMHWTGHVELLVHMITQSKATVLRASTVGNQWELRVLYPNRESLSSTYDFCEAHGLTFDVQSVSEMDVTPSGRYGLTDPQYEALVTAREAGYFQVPRGASLDDLADDLGVSHQALSERIRRGTDVLVGEALLTQPNDE
ncbi:helix-turn-helix domain-containing protein [Halomarina litorea]|uniref:helix-turn-helix domain-containing protein n=1 Tax=Halomarina litorea TaxID=2961595 RepID=UPI0020C3DE13|nr:helix-turn-helix domain-containing protein [Halomarina sp. BCD28]